MKWKETIKVEKLDRLEPDNISSGTGYCQYQKFKLYFDDGSNTTIYCADWYTDISKSAYDECWKLPITNPTETFIMILDLLK